MIAYIMCGPMGSGKSYIAKTLYSHLHVLNPDDFMSTGDWSKNKSYLAWDLVHGLAKSHMMNGRAFVVDSSQANPRNRRKLTQFIRQPNPKFKIVCIYVNACFSTCIRRNDQRERKVPVDQLHKYYTQIMRRPPSRVDGFDQVIVINNEDYSGNEGEVWKTEEVWEDGWYKEA